MTADFRLLGPLTVTVGGSPIPLQSGQARIILTSLLLRGNQVLSVEELIDRVWAADPPKGARNAVQTYVMRLRNALGEAGVLIRTQPSGYLMDVAPGMLDLDRFRSRINAADLARAAHDKDTEAQELREALALWRGAPFSDVASEILHAQEAPRLAEERLRLWERVLDLELALGRHAGLVGELYALTEENPLRERFWGQLMLALHRSDRQADALTVYRRVASLLRDELGVDPSGSLRELYQSILADDQSHAPPRTPPPPAPSPVIAPFQLPADIPDFVGRAELLARLTDLTVNRTGARLAVPVAILAGPPGAGKTALAVHAAHELRSEFPDGQLYVNLRGFSANPPLNSSDALAGFLRALGVPPDQLPHDIDEQGSLLRSRLSGRKILMVLDNAASPDQVRPLLPADAGCAVLITSRNNLQGLTALNGARLFPVDMVSAAEAKTILANVIGAEQVASEPEAADAFVAACGLLPLGLRIASTNLASSTSLSIADYLRKLQPGSKLDAMEIDGDGQAAVRIAFDLSYSALKPSLSGLFRRLSLIPGPEFDCHAAAAVSGLDHAQAVRLLGQLATSNLLGRRTPDRFHFHDLIREFATERANDHDTGDERRDALENLFEYYLRWTRAARGLGYPDAHTMAIPEPEAGAAEPPPWEEPADARDWLDIEAENLVSMICSPAAAGLPTWLLADAMQTYLQRQRHDSISLSAFTSALAAAESSGNRHAQANMLRGLGQLHLHHTRYAEAEVQMARAAQLFHATGDAVGEARARTGLGAIFFETDHYGKAIEQYEASLRLAVDGTDKAGQSLTLFDLGLAQIHQGNKAHGELNLTRSHRMARELRLPYLQMRCVSILALSDQYSGELGSALHGFAHALDSWQSLKDGMAIIETIRNLAQTSFETGRPDLALVLGEEALTQARRIKSPWLQIGSHLVLAGSALATDNLESAGRHLDQARTLTEANDRLTYWNPALMQGLSAWHRRSGRLAEAVAAVSACTTVSRPREQARGHLELAAAHLAGGNHAGAARHARQARDISARHGYRLDWVRAEEILGRHQTAQADGGSATRGREEAVAILEPLRADTEDLLADIVARVLALGERRHDPRAAG